MEKNQKIALVVVILLGLISLMFIGQKYGLLFQGSGSFEWKDFHWEWTKATGTGASNTINVNAELYASSSANYKGCGNPGGSQWVSPCFGSVSLSSDLNLCDYKKVKLDSKATVFTDGTAMYDPGQGSSLGYNGVSISLIGYMKNTLNSHNPVYILQDNKLFVKDLEGHSSLIDCPAYLSVSMSSTYGHKQYTHASMTINHIYFDTDGDDIWDRDDECPNTPGLAIYNGCPEGIKWCEKEGKDIPVDEWTKEKCEKGFPWWWVVVGILVVVVGGFFIWKKIKK